MRVSSNLRSLAAIATVGVAGAVSPMVANAEVSASAAVASNYMWRAQELFSGGTVSGSLDWSHDSGLYSGIWTSSEAGRHEYDMYVGFAGEASDISYDVSYLDYNYPESPAADFEEVHLGVGIMDFAFDAFIGVGETGAGQDYKENYYALSYTMDQITATVGMWDGDANESSYSHLDITYAHNDNLSFLVSKVVSADDNSPVGGGAPDQENDDVKFSVMYSFDIE